ncbi:MAG: hypothetical protein ACRDFB_02205 [Rhabdochlamydiaceae bacterium]
MEWTKTHDYLQLVMKKELETMRQLLDNMNLEEQFILRKEKQYWSSMMEERTHLIKQLNTIRQDRLVVTEKLETLTQHTNVPLEKLLPEQDTNSWEILSLRDQMVTLLDRMNLQTSRNEMLLHLAQTPMPAQVPQSKKKISIATLPSEDYKEGDA